MLETTTNSPTAPANRFHAAWCHTENQGKEDKREGGGEK